MTRARPRTCGELSRTLKPPLLWHLLNTKFGLLCFWCPRLDARGGGGGGRQSKALWPPKIRGLTAQPPHSGNTPAPIAPSGAGKASCLGTEML